MITPRQSLAGDVGRIKEPVQGLTGTQEKKPLSSGDANSLRRGVRQRVKTNESRDWGGDGLILELQECGTWNLQKQQQQLSVLKRVSSRYDL